MWVRDRLDGLWHDEDFADWYPRDGRPGPSPAQLATVSVLQFLLGLSDRDAAEAVRCRIDFKCAPFHSALDRSRKEPGLGRRWPRGCPPYLDAKARGDHSMAGKHGGLRRHRRPCRARPA
ncbi:transposase [Streptomyces sp. Ag109_O5-1]|uniref:transposase n=1 Tax=Streptomyces sp. Ag109_O5-1 TaxID=1938851 RepID=UPI0021A4B8A4|nr:transposase [Streptomyces sp. Ag109_O5-1]